MSPELILLLEAIAKGVVKLGQLWVDAQSGKVDPAVALAAINSFHEQLAADNTAAEQAVHAKFDPTP